MGFFSFFSKDKKEVLDQGLSKTKDSIFSEGTAPTLLLPGGR